MPTTMIPPLTELNPARFDRPEILKGLAAASRQLAEFKGVTASIPHAGILINALGMQEAKDSSAIENIVTTHDELFRDAASPEEGASPEAKEVLRYRQALVVGFDVVSAAGLLTVNHILKVQQELERNDAGFRKVPGTVQCGADRYWHGAQGQLRPNRVHPAGPGRHPATDDGPRAVHQRRRRLRG